jgi:hypothetical protein
MYLTGKGTKEILLLCEVSGHDAVWEMAVE